MLAQCSRALLDCSDAVSVLARDGARIRAVDPRIVPVVADYRDETAALAALDACFARHGAPDLLILWLHPAAPEFRRRLATRLRPPGRFVQVLGSAAADPAAPGHLAALRAVTDGLEVVAQQVVLGFVVEAGGSRWLSHAEIADGVFEAVLNPSDCRVIGTVAPWSARP